MALTLYPVSQRETIIYAGESEEQERVYHTLGFSAQLRGETQGQNCLVIPIPTDVLLTERNFLKGDSNPSHLVSMAKKFSYDVVEEKTAAISPRYGWCQNASELSVALRKWGIAVTERQESFASLLGEFYPEFRYAFCIFTVKKQYQRLTLWLRYEPRFTDRLFLPTLEGTAESLAMNAQVRCEYLTIVSALEQTSGKYLYQRSARAPLALYLPEYGIGRDFCGWYPNADTVCSIENARAGFSDGIHRRPFLGLWHG